MSFWRRPGIQVETGCRTESGMTALVYLIARLILYKNIEHGFVAFELRVLPYYWPTILYR